MEYLWPVFWPYLAGEGFYKVSMQKLCFALCLSLGLEAMEPAPGVHVGAVQYAYSHDRRETFTVEGIQSQFSHRVVFNTALDWAKTAQTTAVARLQELPGASVVVPSIDLPTDQAVVFVGRAVNSRITACVLKAVLAAKPKNLVVCTSSSEYNTIVVGSVHPALYQPATVVTLEALTADDSSPSMNEEILNAQPFRAEILAKRQPHPVVPAGPVVQYDFSKNLSDSLGHGKDFVLMSSRPRQVFCIRCHQGASKVGLCQRGAKNQIPFSRRHGEPRRNSQQPFSRRTRRTRRRGGITKTKTKNPNIQNCSRRNTQCILSSLC